MDPFLEESQNESPGLDPGMLWRAFWRRKLLFFVPLVLCLSMAAVVIKTMTPVYESSGQLYVRTDYLRSQLINDPSQSFGRPRDLDREIMADMGLLLTSPAFLQGVVRELGLDAPIRAEAQAMGRDIDATTAVAVAENRLRRSISLQEESKHLYQLSIRDKDPRQAYDLATYIVNAFVEEYRLARLASRATTREFLEEQKAQYEEDLAVAETALNEFAASMASNDLLDNRVDSGNLSSTEEKLVRVRTRHEGVDAAEFDQLASNARRILGSDPPAGVYARDGVVRALLLELEDLGVDLLTTPETDGEFGDLEIRLGRLRVQLNNRVEEMVAANHPGVGVMDRNRLAQYFYSYVYRSIELQVLRRVQQDVNEYRRFLTQQPLQSNQLGELQEEVDRQRELVATIDQEITQQRMNFEAGLSDIGLQVTVRRQPLYRPGPVEPDVMKLAFMGIVLSIGLGLGLVILAILLDRSFRTVEDIESYLGVKVIGTMPMIQDDLIERRRRLRILRWVIIITAVLAIAAVGFFVVYPALSR